MRDIEELKKHLTELAKNADENAWLIFLSFLRRKNLRIKEYRLEEFQKFIHHLTLEGEDMKTIIEAIISKKTNLFNAQDALETVLAELMDNADTKEMMQKYKLYEQLRIQHMNALGQIPVDEEKASELARQKRRLLLDSVR